MLKGTSVACNYAFPELNDCLCPCWTYCTHSISAVYNAKVIFKLLSVYLLQHVNTQWCNNSFNSVKSPTSATRVYYTVLHFPIGRKITGCDIQWSDQPTDESSLTCQLVWEMLRHACTTKLYCGVHHLIDITQNAAVLWTVSTQSVPVQPSNGWMSHSLQCRKVVWSKDYVAGHSIH